MKNNRPKVSVVVPIYNVEKYIHQCVDSILSQTLQDLEIILIDNGSTDSCNQIIKEYAEKDSRVKPIFIEDNGGYGLAVNQGIAVATGDYIGIVESDDWIESDMYEKLYTKANEADADIVKCDFYMYDSYANPSSVPYPHGNANLQNIYEENKVFTSNDAPLILAYHSSVWASLYKSSFIKQFKFIENEPYVDFPFMFEILLSAERIVLTYDKLLHYRLEKKQNSSTKNPGRRVLKMIELFGFVKKYLEDKKILQKYSEAFYYHATKCCMGFFYNNIPNDIREEFYVEMQNFYKDFPKNFEFLYFEENLKNFVINVQKNNRDLLFNKNSSLKNKIIKILACLIPFKKMRKAFRNNFS